MMEGIIIKNISDLYIVKCNDLVYNCKAKGLFRKLNITPTVGDKVIIDINKNIISEVKTRKNILVRPPISNIDQAFIVMSVKEPDFSTNLLDKFINIIEYNNIKPIICLTKLDLLDNMNEINKYIEYYTKIGYTIVFNTELDKIKELIKGKVSVLTGQTGVGKSSLLNKLDNKLELKTDEISKALGRGKHTTRCTELFNIYDGYIADTPGFSALSFINMTKYDIRDNMIEFNKYKCKYNDCMHTKEDDCKVKENIGKEILESRYNNYIKFLEEL